MGRATEELAARSGPGHRRPAQRHVRQRARADHRAVRAARGAAGGRQGLAGRLDPRQHPARDGRRDARRRPRSASASASTAPRPARRRSMLLLAAVALVMPAIFELVSGGGLPEPGRRVRQLPRRRRAALVVLVAIVLMLTYVAGLFFSLQDAPRPLQPARTTARTRTASRGRVRTAVIMLGDRRRRRRRDVGDPRRLDLRGVRGDRPVASSSSASSSSRSSATPPSTGSRCSSRARTRWTCRSTSRSARARRSRCSSRPCSCCVSFVVGAVPDVARLQRVRARRRSSSRC